LNAHWLEKGCCKTNNSRRARAYIVSKRSEPPPKLPQRPDRHDESLQRIMITTEKRRPVLSGAKPKNAWRALQFQLSLTEAPLQRPLLPYYESRNGKGNSAMHSRLGSIAIALKATRWGRRKPRAPYGKCNLRSLYGRTAHWHPW
jgi:hypothetical protein